MAFPFPPDLQEFVRKRLASGEYASEEEILRNAFQALAEEEEDLDGVREALTEWQAGDSGIPLEDAVKTIRKNHHDSQEA